MRKWSQLRNGVRGKDDLATLPLYCEITSLLIKSGSGSVLLSADHLEDEVLWASDADRLIVGLAGSADRAEIAQWC